MRNLEHKEGKVNIESMQHDADFFSSCLYTDLAQRFFFLRNHEGKFELWDTYKGDWYIVVAVEKCNKITVDRHLINRDLVIGYRNAIREGYNHQLDGSLRNAFDYPRNRNTIKGVLSYIEKIQKNSNVNNET